MEHRPPSFPDPAVRAPSERDGSALSVAPTTIVVVIGGGPLVLVDDVHRDADVVIAADSGLDHALAAGLTPRRLVGDLDSISPAGLRWASTNDLEVVRFPADKDATDTELALDVAAAIALDGVPGCDASLVVLGGDDGERFDHLLATIGALGHPRLAVFRSIDARLGDHRLAIVHPGRRAQLHLPAGATVSLLAAHGDCDGVVVTGTRWPLSEAHLRAGTTLGVSNVVTDPPVQVQVRRGVVTVIAPPPSRRPTPASDAATAAVGPHGAARLAEVRS
jgi:thiamine pyrophosphokinase